MEGGEDGKDQDAVEGGDVEVQQEEKVADEILHPVGLTFVL